MTIRHEKQLPPETAVVVASDIIERCSTLGRGEKNKLIGSRKAKSAGQLDVLAGIRRKIGALQTQMGTQGAGAGSREINLEAIQQAERARAVTERLRAVQYACLKRA